MSKTKRAHTAKFKGDVVLETYRTGSVSDTAVRHSLAENLVSKWRKQFSENMHLVFDATPSHKSKIELTKMERVIGRQTLIIESLKEFNKTFA
jgi:transposase-like protein